MPKIQYKEIRFQQKSLDLIELVNQVVDEYSAQGYELTLRQVYYQLVARGYIPNNERSYKNVGSLINDGRLAGLIDWHSVTDRTRNLRSESHWDTPADVIASARYSYNLDKWKGQPNYVEVWVERMHWLTSLDRLAARLIHHTFHAGATLPSQKCGVLHSVSSGRSKGKKESSSIWATMTQAVLI